ncbi:MAG: general secretion pathway protein GspK [Opitutales bacterium]|nr:general secretion pathway protein GspK [Opitutales bacterium]
MSLSFKKTPPLPGPLQSRRGSVIVAVLAFVVLFSFIVVAFQREAISKIRYAGLFQHQDDLRSHAFSALEATLATINAIREIDGALHMPNQGWGDPTAFIDLPKADGVRIRIRVTDESGRIPLQNVQEDTLRHAFERLGFDMIQASELTDTLLDWMDEDDEARLNGFDGDDYLRLTPPRRPRNGPLRTWDELELIHGWQAAFWDNEGRPLPALGQFREMFSLHHTGAVNINTAPPVVLDVLDSMGLINAGFVLDHRAGPDRIPGTEDDLPIRSRTDGLFLSESNLVGMEARLFRVEVEARRGEAGFLIETLVRWRGSQVGGGRIGSRQTGRTPTDPAADPGPDAPQPRVTARRDARDDPRGTARTTRSGEAAALGYPFEIIRLSENRRL